MLSLRKLAREPLVHFLLIGGAVFAAFAMISEPRSAPLADKQVNVSEAQVDQLAARFRETWRRPPTRTELAALIEAFVKEEILVQEALSLSMDVGDTVIRRRLAQKMGFLVESAAGARQPTTEELRNHFEANRSDYASERLIAFEQVFVGERPTAEDVTAVRAALEDGGTPDALGRATLLPLAMGLSGTRAIDATFGTGFSAALTEAAVDSWMGPVRSGFGLHFVRVTEVADRNVPDFATVRDRVEAAWMAAKSRELADAVYTEQRAGYTVTLPGEAKLMDALK